MNDNIEVNPLPKGEPLLPNITVLAMVPDEWGAFPQLRHYVLARLSRYFHVIWHLEPRYWKKALFCSPSSRVRDGRRRKGVASKGFTVYNPPPKMHKPYSLKPLLDRLRAMQVRALLRKNKAQKTILYVWRPQFKWALTEYSYDLMCYHVDDEYTFSTEEKAIQPDEKALLEQADQVIVHSPALLQKKGGLNPNTVLIPNGVAFEAYHHPRPEPAVLTPIPRPRIGYIGYIKSQLDLNLLLNLAEHHRDWSFVFAGPRRNLEQDRTTVERMFALPNVYDLGPQDPNRLPALAQHFDVCTMCYRLNDYTKYIYPLKLHEYLASGTPVIATPIRSLVDYGDLITLASTESEWSQGIASILAGSEAGADRRKRRIEVARAHGWDRIVGRLARLMMIRLGDSFVERFDEATSHTFRESVAGSL